VQFRVPQKVHNLVQGLTMPPQLPQLYMFKLLYSNRNPIVMDVLLLIDEDGVFFFLMVLLHHPLHYFLMVLQIYQN